MSTKTTKTLNPAPVYRHELHTDCPPGIRDAKFTLVDAGAPLAERAEAASTLLAWGFHEAPTLAGHEVSERLHHLAKHIYIKANHPTWIA